MFMSVANVPLRPIQIIECQASTPRSACTISQEEQLVAESMILLSRQPSPASQTRERTEHSKPTLKDTSTRSKAKTPPRRCRRKVVLSASDLKNKETRDTIRKRWKKQAQEIPTSRGTQANAFQLFILEWVYREITAYPEDAWMALIAVNIHRSYNQVKHWFSNKRQVDARTKAKAGSNALETEIEKVRIEGRTVCLRPSAIQEGNLEEKWSDEGFKKALDGVTASQRQKLETNQARG